MLYSGRERDELLGEGMLGSVSGPQSLIRIPPAHCLLLSLREAFQQFIYGQIRQTAVTKADGMHGHGWSHAYPVPGHAPGI